MAHEYAVLLDLCREVASSKPKHYTFVPTGWLASTLSDPAIAIVQQPEHFATLSLCRDMLLNHQVPTILLVN